MPVQVISSEAIGTVNAKVVVECDNIEEALGTKAKEVAIMGAKNVGLFRAGISSTSGPYPVNAEGQDCTLSAQPGMKYRNDFNLSGGLGS